MAIEKVYLYQNTSIIPVCFQIYKIRKSARI